MCNYFHILCRHLSSQLLEMERLIDKMLSTEFERYATADLNRPLVEDQQVLEGVSILWPYYNMVNNYITYKLKDSFYQQIGLKFEEETNKMLHLEHGFVWC